MKDQRPNIIMIVVHDLGTQLGSYQNDPAIPSANLDRFAQEGVRFENHFCTAPFCSPSRGSIITGKYPHENGLLGLTNLGWNMPSTNLFLAQALKNSGYNTSLYGHQHENQDSKNLGFESINHSANDKCAEVTPLVVDFIRQQSCSNSKPFFCQTGFKEVHRSTTVFKHDCELELKEKDITPLPYLKDTPGLRKDMKDFYGTIQDMDNAVGAILDTLDDSPLKENTLVVFTTDHGIAFPRAKATLYDAGINTALLMRWPAGFGGGRVFKQLLSNIDIFPTLLQAAGADIGEDISGRSFLPLLQGEEYEEKENIFAGKNSQPGDIKRCVRTGKYKYIRNFNSGPMLLLPKGMEMSPTGLMMDKEHLMPRPEFELYDLSVDPYEKNNLAGKPEYTEVEKQLSESLEKFMKKTGDPLLDGPLERPSEEKGKLERYATACENLVNRKD